MRAAKKVFKMKGRLGRDMKSSTQIVMHQKRKPLKSKSENNLWGKQLSSLKTLWSTRYSREYMVILSKREDKWCRAYPKLGRQFRYSVCEAINRSMELNLPRGIELIGSLSFLLIPVAILPTPALAGKTCTAITSYGPVYVGCTVKGNDITFSKTVHGIQGISGGTQNPNNPGCYDLDENGIAAVCTYRR